MKILTLFFTYGTSLSDWEKNGTLDRELSIYKKFLTYFDKIYFITYGSDDSKFSDRFPKNIVILPKKYNINNLLYSFLAPFAYKKEIRESIWLKTNQMLGSWSAILAKTFFRKKLNLRTGYTESLSHIRRSFLKKIFTIIIEYFAYKIADISTVSSEFQMKYILEKCNPKKIYIVPNGIETELFKPAENKTSGEKTRLLFVGRLHPEKNLMNLLNAVKEIKNIKLTIVGQGPMEKEIIESKERNNLDLDMIPRVPNSQMPQIYNGADVYVQPSIYEGNPKTILEAMSCGLPVIATEIEGIINIIKNNENGLLCKQDYFSIMQAIENAANCPNLETISKNSRKFVEDNYSLNEMVKKEINLYEIFR